MTGRRRRAVVATTIVIAVVATTISIWLVATRARTPAQRAAEAAPPPPSELTAIVEKGPLSDEFTLGGRLRQQSQLSISGPEVANGRSVVTDLPVKRGDRVENRQLVAVVSGRPVIALEGKFDSYRDLHIGDKGPDVRQLRLALGLWGDDDYDDATAKSVARLYNNVGYSTPVYEPPDSTVSDSVMATPAKPADPVDGGLLPMNEVVFLPTLPANVVEVTAAIGVKGDQPLLTLASGGWQVAAKVNEDERAELEDLPQDTSMSIVEGPAQGKEVTFSGINAGKESEQDEVSYEATFKFADSPGIGLGEGQPMSVRIVRKKSPPEAVVVPVSALWTKPGGEVEVRIQSDSGMTAVPVEVLFSVEGQAAVTGSTELAAGVRVAVGSRVGDHLG